MNSRPAIYTITSELHDETAIKKVTEEFLNSLEIGHVFRGNDFSDYGNHVISLIYVRTGGTENIFKSLLPTLMAKSHHPIYLLTSGKSNSLAASMEILSFLNQNNIKGEIIHGTTSYIKKRITLLTDVCKARQALNSLQLGIIGKPSDWLISSSYDTNALKDKLGIDLVEVDMQEMMDAYASIPDGKDDYLANIAPDKTIREYVPGAMRIYEALRVILEKHNLNGFTIRCFDLLSAVNNTGCVALAKLNSEGYVAGCEGDVPAMISMAIAKAVSGVSGFQANPAFIDTENGEILFAHCTIPLNMLSRYELDTHFESGVGIGIRGYMPEGPVTIFKCSGDLSRIFISEGTLVRSQSKKDLCRTQQIIKLDNREDATYFLTEPIGNHHIIIPGHHKDVMSNILAF